MYQYVAVHDIEHDYKGIELREVSSCSSAHATSIPTRDTGDGGGDDAKASPRASASKSGAAHTRKRKRKRPRSATPVCLSLGGGGGAGATGSSGLLACGVKRWKRANSMCAIGLGSAAGGGAVRYILCDVFEHTVRFRKEIAEHPIES